MQEKKANNLWENFTLENEEKFWRKYEKLIWQQKKHLAQIQKNSSKQQATTATERVLFYAKMQKLTKDLVDLREKHLLVKLASNDYGITAVVLGLLFLNPILGTIVPSFIAIGVIGPALFRLGKLEAPQYFEVINSNLVCHNYKQGLTAYVPIYTMLSLKLIYNSYRYCHTLKIEAQKQNYEFDYHLNKKEHQAFLAFFQGKSIPFDDRYYN